MAWPNKTIPNFTDEELVTAIEEHEGSSDPVTCQITQGAIREWERRNGLPSDD
ncbi:hypothetical protein AB0C39_23160 [Streptomyces parvulus]|uniref:hypothetical protein n=1 Tax=Streptomyces parvulus TaxID=146923 RepID=UPI0033E616D4